MAVEKLGEQYKCNICGNEVNVTKVSGGTLVCCSQDMERIEERGESPVNLPDVEG